MPVDIPQIVARRSDLSTFVVHVCRDGTDASDTAATRLKSILSSGKLEARSPFGMAKARLDLHSLSTDSQKCVCFTETPLEHLHLILQEIRGRQCQFAPYGIAMTKRMARKIGINPVWYVDITPGHNWLTVPINNLIDTAIAAGNFDQSAVAAIAPFIEQMGQQAAAPGTPGYWKEFWWEREWRHLGDRPLPLHFIVLCPEDEIPAFTAFCQPLIYKPAFIDPRWGLEHVIAHLAGFQASDIKLL